MGGRVRKLLFHGATAAAVLSILLASAGVFAQYRNVYEQRVRQQQRDNRQWENEAKQRQKDLYQEATKAYKRKDYSKAATYYVKALNVTYPQWDIREHRRVMSSEGDDRTVLLPDRSRNPSKETLTTGLNEKIKGQLDKIGEMRTKDTVDQLYKRAQELHSEGNSAAAYRLLAELKGANLPDDIWGKYESKVNSLAEQIEKKADELLDAVSTGIEKEELESARASLGEFTERFGSFSAYGEAHQRYMELRRNRKLHQLIAEEDAAARLEQGLASLEEKEYVAGYDALNEVAQRYANTEAGQKAAEKLTELHADKQFMEQVKNLKASDECGKLLQKAKNYRVNNMLEQAEEIYRKIIQEYPDTKFAEEAGQCLSEMGVETVATEAE